MTNRLTCRRPRFAAAAGALVLVAAVLAVTAGDLRTQVRELDSRAAASSAFAGALAQAGGEEALERCSRIRTSTRARSLVAWRLDLPLRDLDARPVRPAVVIRAKWFYGQGLEPPRPARLPDPRLDAVLAVRRQLRPRPQSEPRPALFSRSRSVLSQIGARGRT